MTYVGPDTRLWTMDYSGERVDAWTTDPKTGQVVWWSDENSPLGEEAPSVTPEGEVWMQDDGGNLFTSDKNGRIVTWEDAFPRPNRKDFPGVHPSYFDDNYDPLEDED